MSKPKFVKLNGKEIKVEEYKVKDVTRFVQNYDRRALEQHKWLVLTEEQRNALVARFGTLEKYGLWQEVFGGALREARKKESLTFEAWFEVILGQAAEWDV